MQHALILPMSSSCTTMKAPSSSSFSSRCCCSFGPVLILAATLAVAFTASVVFVEFATQGYTPDKNRDIFSLLVMRSDRGGHVRVRYSNNAHATTNGANKMKRRLLFCTMLSNEFSKYAFGAAKLAEAVRRDAPLLSSRLNLHVEAALLEMAERPVPLVVWQGLRKSGWQRKITRPRIPPRREGVELQPSFADQLTKLHLFGLVEYDWVLYMDSDIFIVRSLVPCIAHVILQPVSSIAAARDLPAFPDAFNMGMFMVRPSLQEYEMLLCRLHGCSGRNVSPIPFVEAWMEQGFLNAVYKGNWTEVPETCAMNLALWQQPWLDEVWRPNATSISAIHFTVEKPWNWLCPWTQYAPLCYLFWNSEELRFSADVGGVL